MTRSTAHAGQLPQKRHGRTARRLPRRPAHLPTPGPADHRAGRSVDQTTSPIGWCGPSCCCSPRRIRICQISFIHQAARGSVSAGESAIHPTQVPIWNGRNQERWQWAWPRPLASSCSPRHAGEALRTPARPRPHAPGVRRHRRDGHRRGDPGREPRAHKERGARADSRSTPVCLGSTRWRRTRSGRRRFTAWRRRSTTAPLRPGPGPTIPISHAWPRRGHLRDAVSRMSQ